MATIVTYNRGAQGGPFSSLSEIDPSTHFGFFEDFIDNAGLGYLTLADWVDSTDPCGVIKADETATDAATTIISKTPVLDTLGDGEAYAFTVRMKADAAAADHLISFGFAEDAAAAIGATDVSAGFQVVGAASSGGTTVITHYDDNTKDTSDTSSVFSTIDGLKNFDITAFNEYGFVMQRSGGAIVCKTFVAGVKVGEIRVPEGSADTTFNSQSLFFAVFSDVGDGGWSIDWIRYAGNR